jgi:hypothetical protein
VCPRPYGAEENVRRTIYALRDSPPLMSRVVIHALEKTILTASPREETPILGYMLARWRFMVASERCSEMAIWWLLIPRATMSKTSISRLERPSASAGFLNVFWGTITFFGGLLAAVCSSSIVISFSSYYAA